eukprot:Sdes_comp19872_c0_seq1m12156
MLRIKSMFLTEGHTLGINALYALSNNLSLGGEVLFSLEQYAPGFSFGIRHLDTSVPCFENVSTCVFSPIPGHLSFGYMSRLGNQLAVATRYEYNVHSKISEFALGVLLSPWKSPFGFSISSDDAFLYLLLSFTIFFYFHLLDSTLALIPLPGFVF